MRNAKPIRTPIEAAFDIAAFCLWLVGSLAVLGAMIYLAMRGAK